MTFPAPGQCPRSWRHVFGLPQLKGTDMADYRELYAGRYLKAEDVKDRPFRAAIERVESEKMNDGKEKLVVYPKDWRRGTVLNATRYEALVALAGSHDTDKWVEMPILVSTGKTKNPQGKTVDCIVLADGRVKTAAQKRKEVKGVLKGDGIPKG